MPGEPTLHRARPADEARLHRLLSEPAVYQFLADGAPPPPAATRAWLTASATDFELFGVGLWLLLAPGREASGPLAGACRLSDIESGSVELTYLLHPDYWGRGLATRMAHTVIAEAFARGLTRVWAGADVPNGRSVAVMQRLGLTFERRVNYPAGPGVEHALHAAAFHLNRYDVLKIAGGTKRSSSGARACAATCHSGR